MGHPGQLHGQAPALTVHHRGRDHAGRDAGGVSAVHVHVLGGRHLDIRIHDDDDDDGDDDDDDNEIRGE